MIGADGTGAARAAPRTRRPSQTPSLHPETAGRGGNTRRRAGHRWCLRHTAGPGASHAALREHDARWGLTTATQRRSVGSVAPEPADAACVSGAAGARLKRRALGATVIVAGNRSSSPAHGRLATAGREPARTAHRGPAPGPGQETPRHTDWSLLAPRSSTGAQEQRLPKFQQHG